MTVPSPLWASLAANESWNLTMSQVLVIEPEMKGTTSNLPKL